MRRPFQNVKSYFIIKKKTVVILVLIIAAIGAVIYFTRGKEPEKVLPIVSTVEVGKSDVNVYGEYVGRVRAQQFVEVHARVEGFLEKMLFEEGTYVEKNQVLFVIDQRQYKAKVDKALAQLNKDQAQERKTQQDLERIRPLSAEDADSQLA